MFAISESHLSWPHRTDVRYLWPLFIFKRVDIFEKLPCLLRIHHSKSMVVIVFSFSSLYDFLKLFFQLLPLFCPLPTASKQFSPLLNQVKYCLVDPRVIRRLSLHSYVNKEVVHGPLTSVVKGQSLLCTGFTYIDRFPVMISYSSAKLFLCFF